MERQIPSHLPSDGQLGQFNSEELDVLRGSPLLKEASAAIFDAFIERAFVRHVAHGAFLTQPGEPNYWIYILLEGQLGAYYDAEQQSLILRVAPGESIMEINALGAELGTIYLVAQWPSKLAAIPAVAFREILGMEPRLALQLLDVLGQRLQTIHQSLAAIAAEDRLGFSTHHDAVTGLPNRRWAEETYRKSIEAYQAQSKESSLMLVDIDWFTKMNQSLGRASCDALLRHVGQAMKNLYPNLNTIARQGGGLFLALWPGPLEEAREAAERIRHHIAGRQFPLRGHYTTQLTVSAGVAAVVTDFTAALEQAYHALDVAKQRGRNRVEIWTPPAE
ncbi:MAG: GGDEF domain-containing protein [Pigmentiphaga sp.]